MAGGAAMLPAAGQAVQTKGGDLLVVAVDGEKRRIFCQARQTDKAIFGIRSTDPIALSFQETPDIERRVVAVSCGVFPNCAVTVLPVDIFWFENW